MAAKQPFQIDRALDLVRAAVVGFPPAALFQLRDEGFGSVFEQLVACMISIRTRDEMTLPIARRVFERARTPAAMAALPVEEIDALIVQSSFHAPKAAQVSAIARRAVREFDNALPCDYNVLVSLPGVGPKCANLVLGIACGRPAIAVDIHVHRVANRWGYVHAGTPESTLVALAAVLPKEHWIEINRLLVPFGKHICTGSRPRCSTCPVLDMCEQNGVTNAR
jgi:endonuclease III